MTVTGNRIFARSFSICLFLFCGPGFASINAWSETTEGKAPAQFFDRLKKLEGTWRGKSTKGWTGNSTMRVIARGSVLMSTSEFDDAPDEGMATMYHLDGKDLLLTHYCEAGNVPMLRASEISEDGNKITFEFVRGSNLPSRDTGHMDKVVFHFIDDNHFNSRWTWYQNGKETWLEEIEYTRVR